MDVTPQLDLDGVVTQMFSAVKHCSETVRSMVGSLGRIDASILDDVRVSTPVNIASLLSKPRIFFANSGNASRIASIANCGKASLKSVIFTFGL